MWLLRLLGMITVVAIVAGVITSLVTRNPVYLRFSWRLFRYAVVVALLIFALMILERVAVIL